MKNIFYLFNILFIPFIGCTQTNFNEITSTEFDEIKFNEVSLSQIMEFNGSSEQLSNLFGFQFSDVTHELNDEGKEFDSSVIAISIFEDQLGGIEVKNSEVNVRIGNNTFSIGDNASILGYGSDTFNYFLNPNDAEIGIAIFKPMLNDTYVYIRFNKDSGIIEEIGFRSPT